MSDVNCAAEIPMTKQHLHLNTPRVARSTGVSALAITLMLIASPVALAQYSKPTVDANNTLSADRPILPCPTPQKPAKNGAAPEVELVKKVLRCRLGEKAAPKGYDGAVTIEIGAVQIGKPRQWDRLLDTDGGVPGKTTVYPVKVTYTEKTHYRGRTEVNENWIRIFNFFVNGFDEWQYGSTQPVKSPDRTSVPREK